MGAISLTFYGTTGKVYRGLVIGRDGHMIKVVFDSVEDKPARVSWIDPTAQIGRVVLGTEKFTPVHGALKMVLQGDADKAEAILHAEWKQRQAANAANK